MLNANYFDLLCFFLIRPESLSFFNGSGFEKARCLDESEVKNFSIDSCFCFTTFFGRFVKSGSGPAKIVSKRVLRIPYF